MKKRLSRNFKKVAILLIAVVAIILLTWVLSHMGGVLNWLVKNWLPCLIGFVIGTVGYAIVDGFFKEEDKK